MAHELDDLSFFCELNAAEAVAAAKTSEILGLSSSEAARRLRIFGANTLVAPPLSPILQLLAHVRHVVAHLANVYEGILIAAAVLLALLKEWTPMAVVGVCALTNVAISLSSEASAKRLSASLAQQLNRDVRVVRNGVETVVHADALVPGDVLLLTANDTVPADVVWIEAHHVMVSETILTGRTELVEKHARPSSRNEPLARRHNLGFCGTLVTAGAGRAVVIQTGLRTEMGRLTQASSTSHARAAPLPQQLRALGVRLCVACTLISLVSFLVARFAWHTATNYAAASAIAVAVAIVPEVLPLGITLMLRQGERIMRQHYAIITKLEDVDSVGTISAICFDKTGTLTQNIMVASRVVVFSGSFHVGGQGYRPVGSITPAGGDKDVAAMSSATLQTLLRGCICISPERVRVHAASPAVTSPTSATNTPRPLNAFSHVSNKQLVAQLQWTAQGDPTDAALLVLGLKLHAAHPNQLEGMRAVEYDGPDAELGVLTAVAVHYSEEPPGQSRLSSSHLRMSIKHIRGSLDAVLPLCTTQRTAGPPQPLDAAYWQREHDQLCAAGLRVIALAECTMPSTVSASFAMCALIGISDTLRPGLPSMFAACHEAGMQCIMLTGDDVGTAVAVATEARLPIARVTTGAELRGLRRRELIQRVMLCSIVARATAEDKAMVVDALQSGGHSVAMVGDGVNDVPAMRQADVSIALKSANSSMDLPTQTARMEVFAHRIVGLERVIADARHTYACLQRILLFMLSTSCAQCSILCYAMLANVYPPLAHVHVLYHNIAVGLTVAATMATPVVPSGTHKGRPRLPGQPILTHFHMLRVCITAAVWTVLTYVQEVIAHDMLRVDHKEQLTISFVTFGLTQLTVAASCCCDRIGWAIDLPRAGLCILANAAATLFVMYVPGVNNGMELCAMQATSWALCLWVPVAVGACAHALEYVRWRSRRWLFYVSRSSALQKLSRRARSGRFELPASKGGNALYEDELAPVESPTVAEVVNPGAVVRRQAVSRRSSVRFLDVPSRSPSRAPPATPGPVLASRRDIAAAVQRSTRAVLARPLQQFVVPILPVASVSGARPSISSLSSSSRYIASMRRGSNTAAVAGVLHATLPRAATVQPRTQSVPKGSP